MLFEFFHYLQSTELATGLRQSDYAFPLIEGSHIMALSLSVGFVLMFDLRLLRLAFQGEPVSRMMQQVMKVALPGFALMFITGLTLFLAQAESAAKNHYFQAKMLALLLLGINALVYQVKFYPKMAEWDMASSVPTGVRVIAAVSLVFWMLVIAFGRIMAYEL